MRLSTLNPIGQATWPASVCGDSRFGIVTKRGRLESGSRLIAQEQMHSLGYHPRTEAPSLTR